MILKRECIKEVEERQKTFSKISKTVNMRFTDDLQEGKNRE